jgi:hypothetical protein
VLDRPCATLYHLQLRLLFAGRRYAVPAEDDALGFGALDAALGALRLRSTIHAGMEPTPRDAVLTLRALLPGAAALPDAALVELIDGRPFLVAIDCAELSERLPEAGEGRLGAALAQLLSRRPPSAALDGASYRVAALGGLRQAAALDALGDIAAELGEDQRRLVWALEDLLGRAAASAAPSEPDVELRPHDALRTGQWDTVALIGCNEGLLPSPREMLDDERRRMYDAMLRARRRLIVSWVQADGWAAPSRFLIEAGIG